MHRGGRTVAAVRFSSGLCVVYKPRSLSTERHFQELLAWLNARGAQPSFRTLRLLDRGEYGWMEFAEREECASPEAVRRFYERQGGLLAVLYGLLATDAHYENVLAAGEHPLFIDAESLFHPHFVEDAPAHARTRAAIAVATSVLRVGMLPQRSWGNAESAGVDYSALGARPGQISPRPAQYVADAGTDGMRLARRRLVLTAVGKDNRPRLHGEDVDIRGFEGALVEGFTRVYRLLVAHREELLSQAGPLVRFADDEVRAILRPTHLYSLILRESYHPDLLRDALDRESFFDRLWAVANEVPYVSRVIPAERADLWRGDIPMFTTRPGSRDVWTSTHERLPDYFPRSGLSRVMERVAALGEEDLRRQRWFIEASLATLSEDMGGGAPYLPAEPRAPVERSRLLRAALAVGERLETLALRAGDEAWWVGMMAEREHEWRARALGMDLYGGVTGIALFLAWLGEVTGEERPRALAQAAMCGVRQELARGAPVRSVGGFQEGGGLVYTLTQLGALWGEPSLLDEAERIAGGLEEAIAGDERLDVLSGVAGALAALLALHAHRPSARTLALATRCGERLLEKATRMPQGLGWVPQVAPRPLTGFSHGAAGIAWALMALAAATGETRFREAALAALDFERSQFVPEAGNWRDLREREPEALPAFLHAWCHGAPGIGLGRLGLLGSLDTPRVREEISTAVGTTLARGFGASHCLCHGDLGNLELVSLAAERLSDAALALERDRLAARVLESLEAEGWRCGVPRGMESPGLMNGLAGIGYGLLRLAEPSRVPCVLLLEPPPRRS
ncbi:type 2 lantipeptide synthetase LanM [Corallococcus exercitus]|nr:type 2 lantipeptide synthetase LanM [Corallococcus exercitus]